MHIFNKVKIQTPESVELEFTLAGIGNRALALVIDYIIMGLVFLLFAIAWIYFLFGIVNETLTQWLLAIYFLIFFFIYVGYFVFFEVLWQGQTPGKRYAKIRVIRDDGRTVGLQQATLRALLRPFDEVVFMGVLLIVLGKQEKRLGDWAAGTLVVQDEQPIATATFPISDVANSLADKLLAKADLSLLLPDDFAVIREYLQRRGDMTAQAKEQLSQKLSQRIEQVLVLDEKLGVTVSPEVFLEAVYLAYQQQKR